MWNQNLKNLDLSRRRVAAISFLSSISINPDDFHAEPRLDCLKVMNKLKNNMIFFILVLSFFHLGNKGTTGLSRTPLFRATIATKVKESRRGFATSGIATQA